MTVRDKDNSATDSKRYPDNVKLWSIVLSVALVAIVIYQGVRATRVTVEVPSDAQAADAAQVAPTRTAELRDYTYTQIHMAMPVRITVYASDERLARTACRAAFERISGLEKKLSDYNPNSEVCRLTSAVSETNDTGSFPYITKVSRELFDVLTTAKDVHQRSGGAFDPTSGPVVQLWRQARKRRILPTAEEIESARQGVGLCALDLDAATGEIRISRGGLQLDLGAIAKGFIADQALQKIQTFGIMSSCIEAGGDFVVGEAPPNKSGWKIDIPFRGQVILSNCGVSVSGDTSQFVIIDSVRYSHVVDPRTGVALTNRRLAVVIAPCGEQSDALATAGCVMDSGEFAAMIAEIPATQGWQYTVTSDQELR